MLYVRKYFQNDSQDDALEMVENIRGAFSQILDEVKWMDDDTKGEAKKKLKLLIAHIGHPDKIPDNNDLEKMYNEVKINPDKYMDSYLNLLVLITNDSFSQLRLSANRNDSTSQGVPYEVEASYTASENRLELTAGIWQDHFFNSRRPKYMNYGAIGFVIGHEITHGFDDEGSQYNGNGNLVDWWQPDARSKFLQRTKCIIEQYGNYTDQQTGLKLNGINTQGENIADNGGVKVAYRAYNQWAAKNGPEPGLPGLNYSPQQMFWISYAQTWCAKYRTEHLSNMITTYMHSPNEFRILGSLRNMKEFSRDFQCPEGSSMNPVHKREVW